MPLLTLPRFRRKETSMPETTAPAKTESNVLMRFQAQGGATVEVRKSYRTTRWDQYNPNGQEVIYPWVCLGCDYDKDNWTHLYDAREEANAHAEKCRAMPKPEA